MPAERLAGILLIAFGALLLVVLQTGVGAEVIPLLIGVGFLIAYAATRLYGLLIPGGILAGLGTGVVVSGAGGPDAAPVLGLGLGFLAVALVDRLVRGAVGGQWWPLIPGGILAIIGLGAIPATREATRYLVPVALIAAGLWLVVGRWRRPAGRPQGDAPAPQR